MGRWKGGGDLKINKHLLNTKGKKVLCSLVSQCSRVSISCHDNSQLNNLNLKWPPSAGRPQSPAGRLLVDEKQLPPPPPKNKETDFFVSGRLGARRLEARSALTSALPRPLPASGTQSAALLSCRSRFRGNTGQPWHTQQVFTYVFSSPTSISPLPKQTLQIRSILLSGVDVEGGVNCVTARGQRSRH